MTAIRERTVLFADLRGSTGLYESLGNAEASGLVTQTVSQISEAVLESGGHLIKTLGDGLMAAFETPRDGVRAAQRMQEMLERTVQRARRLNNPAMLAMRLQVALARGEVVELNGDCFGDAVNVAARLIDHAGDGEILITAEVLAGLHHASKGRFRSLDRISVRGRIEPVHVYRMDATVMLGADDTATQFGEPMRSVDPDGMRLVWQDLDRVFDIDAMPIVLGRSVQATYCITDARVSRSHVRIDWQGSSFELTDLSYNGTYVRFGDSGELLSLKRGSCTLHGSGIIGLGGLPTDDQSPIVRFEVLHFADTEPQAFGGASFKALMTFLPEPPHRHGAAPAGPDTVVLLCNLGTPEAPTAPALRRYLAQFLADPRVVEIPRLIWLVILHGIILRVRPAKSAAKYATVWTSEGSPLKVWTARQAKLLQGVLGERGQRVRVAYAMRYGEPAIAATLDALKREGVKRVLVLPAYPQYSGATTASVIDDVARWALQTRHLPELRFINRYHDDAAYIAALAQSVREHWQRDGRADKLVMSFHGMPERTLHLGDPYHCECLKTGRLLAEALGLKDGEWLVTFQSRFGKAKWLEPYTEPSLVKLAQGRLKTVDVICPGFAVDCLETLEEIAQEARDAFLAAGGQRFAYIPCLNDHPAGMRALAKLAERHLQGWPTEAPHPDTLALERQRALAAGAAQ